MSLISDHTETVVYKGANIKLPLFLDYQSTTPLAPQVHEVLVAALKVPGNSASSTHIFGLDAKEKIEKAKEQIADLIAARPDEIIFTSGATEANNLALLGYARQFKGKGHIISVETEHNSVLSALNELNDEGFDVTYLPVEKDGRLSLKKLEAALSAQTILVSIHAANNETGTLQEIEKIGALCRTRKITFHTDAVQALSTKSIDVIQNEITLLSLSGHKLYGPQGIGALYVKRGTPFVSSSQGGEHQQNIRAGTLPTALIAGLGEACQLAKECRNKDDQQLLHLSAIVKDKLKSELGDEIQFNGNQRARIPGCLNFTFKDIDAEDLLLSNPSLALSTGSACASTSHAPSHVLLAMGLSASEANGTVRMGLGRYVTEIEADFAASLLVEAYRKMKT
ncbi:MAG: cysteine desulfurase [Sneathiella sp.]|nr:cysteine desulfurase [Sneathiella sp.]